MEWAPLISALSLVLVAIIEAVAARDRKYVKQDREQAEKRAALRAKESRLSMEMMSATCALSLVVAKKLTGRQTNGDVGEAMEKADAAQKAYVDFLHDTAARQVTKM